MVLQLPRVVVEQQERDAEQPTKRRRGRGRGGGGSKQPHVQQPAEQREEDSEVTLQVSSHLLKSASEKFQ